MTLQTQALDVHKQTYDDIALLEVPSPREQIAQATEWAAQLTNIVEQARLYRVIMEKKYLMAEAWEIVLTFARTNPVTEWTEMLRDDNGEVCAVKAKVNIMDGNDVVGSGIMTCGYDDFPCQNRTGTAKLRAAESTAQTWAMSKAARVKYSWVVSLAGYEPLPADEMGLEETVIPPRQPTLTPARVVQAPQNSSMSQGRGPQSAGRGSNSRILEGVKCPKCGKERIIKSQFPDKDFGNDAWVCWKVDLFKDGDTGCDSRFRNDDEAIQRQLRGEVIEAEMVEEEDGFQVEVEEE
jgi:hypothetical protein